MSNPKSKTENPKSKKDLGQASIPDISQYKQLEAQLQQETTERKQLEKLLQKQKVEQQIILDSVPAMIWYKDTENRILQLNKYAAETMSLSVDEVEGKSVYDLNPNEAAHYHKDDLEVINSGKPKLGIIEPLQTSSGAYRWLQTDKIPYRNEEGAITGVLVFAIDITERRQAEIALQESEARYKAIFDNVPVAIFTKNKEGVYTSLNKNTLRYWSQNPLGHTDIELLEPEIGQAWRANDVKVMETGQEVAVEETVHLPTGTQVVLSRKLPTYDTDGNVTGILGISVDITERKRAEEELQRQRAFLRQVLDLNPHFIFAKDRHGRFTLANKAFADAYGTTVEELIGKTDADFNPHAELVERYNRDDLKVIETGQELFIPEEEIIDIKGEHLWRKTVKRPIIDENGVVTQVLGVATDITDRKRVEQSLQLTQFTVDRAAIDIVWLGPDGRLLYVNDQACRSFGYSREELLSMMIYDINPGPWTPETWPAHWAELKERGSFSFETRHRRKNGQIFPVEVTVNHIEFGDRAYNCAFFRDITEQKQAEEILAQERNLLRTLVDNIPDHIYVKDTAGRFIFGNLATARSLGAASPEEIVGKTDYEFSPPELAAQFYADDQAFFQSGQSPIYIEDMIIDHVTRQQRWVLATKALLRDAQGQIVGLVGVNRDITDNKRLEQQVQAWLERRGRQIQLSALTAQEMAALTDLDQFFQNVVARIKEQLGFYHAQLYRYNPDTKTLKLVAGYGGIGAQMLAESYQVALGQGLIGAAAASGAPMLQPDIAKASNRRASQSWRPNPYLPQTRGELAIPIKSGREEAQAQLAALEYFIESGFDGLMVSVIDRGQATPLTQKALRQNIPVVSFTSVLGPEEQTTFFGSSEHEMGYTLGLQAGAWAKVHIPAGQRLKVAILSYRLLPQLIEREEGIIAGLNQVFEGELEIVASETAGDSIQGLLVAERWLERYPDLHMILGINDDVALGAYQAVIAADRDDPARFFIGGIDGVEGALAAIKKRGVYQATVDLRPREAGMLAVRYLVCAAKGQLHQNASSGWRATEIKPRPVNQANLDEFLNLAERAVMVEPQPWEADLSGLDLSGIRIGLSLISLANPFFMTLANGARAEAERLGIELVVSEAKQLLGVLAVQSDVAGALDVEDQVVLEGVAGQVVTAIENARLLEEANIFRQFAEATGQGMSVATLEGNLVYLNPVFAKILGEAAHEAVIGSSIWPYFPEEIQPRLQNEVLPAVIEQGGWAGELPLRTIQGKFVPALQTYSLIREKNGNPQYIAIISTDITERKQAEAELEARLQELNSLQRLMSREGWQAFQATRAGTAQGYLFDQTEVRPLVSETTGNGDAGPALASQLLAGNSQSAVKPVAVRGEVIGQIGIYDGSALSGDSALSRDSAPSLDGTSSVNGGPPKGGGPSLTDEEQEFLDSIAEELAEALERARLLEQIQKRAAELEAVAEVSSVASTTLEIDKLLQAVVDLTKDSFGLYHAHIYLLNEANNVLVLGAGAGEVGRRMVSQDWRISLDREHSLVARAARTQQSVIANNVRQEVDFLPNPLLPDTRSELAVPMIVGNKLLGVLDVQASAINRFTDDDAQVMSTLATQVAVALQNASLIQQTQAALAETEQLYEISGTLSSAASLDEVLQVVVSHALTTEVNSASLLTIELDGEGRPEWVEIIAAWERQGAPAMPPGSRFYLPDFPMARLWIDNPGEPMLIADIVNDERVDAMTQAIYQQIGFQASIILPLQLGKRWIGLISLNWFSVQKFSDKDERLYQAIAAQAAVVVNNLLQIRRTQAALAEAENLYEASRRVNEAHDLQGIVAAVAETGPVSIFNRAVLNIFEHNADGEIVALNVAANWHSGQGRPPTAVGTRYGLVEFSYLRVLLKPEAVFYEDAQEDERLDSETQSLARQLNIHATAVLPLWSGERRLGVLMLESEESYHFSPDETQPYIALARQAAVALENRRLLEETRSALAEVEAIQRRYTVQSWESYRDRQVVQGYEQTGEQGGPLSDERLPAEVSQAVAHKQTTVIAARPMLTDGAPPKDGVPLTDDVPSTDGTPPTGGVAKQESDQSLLPAAQSNLMVPLKIRDEVIGVLGLQEEAMAREWSPEEIALVEAIAEQLAQAAENIRLIDETQQRAARERRVNEIGEKIQAVQSLEEALQIAIQEVGRSLQAPRTMVRLEVD
jgi:PAS domain S-box-containing protein